MNTYKIDNEIINSIELKCLAVSRGIKVSNSIYRKFSNEYRVDVNPLACNCFMLSDGTVIQLTDMSFHLKYLGGMLSWDNIKLLKYASELGTFFSLELIDDKPAIMYKGNFLDFITFPVKTDFYRKKTPLGTSFIGNAVLQGTDWVSFQCLWPCEYAACGKPCEFCFSGADFEKRAQSSKPMPNPLKAEDVAYIVNYAFKHVGCNSIQITGGSTFSGTSEYKSICSYLLAISETTDIDKSAGSLLLYITPPADTKMVDEYFSLGADRIACSLEVWDEKLAEYITPGKIEYTTRERHLKILKYIAGKYGSSNAFSNFIIGLESFETLREGAKYLAQNGILPTASVWMPMGKPVRGSMKAPDTDYYRRVIDLYAELYTKYNLVPAKSKGLNVCIEQDIWNNLCT